MGLPNPSLAVTVIVDVPVPAAIGDVAVTVAWAADTTSAFTTTSTVWTTAIPVIVAETVLVPAAVELKVPVATPLAFVGALGCVSVLPGPVAASTTVAPATGFPDASRAVTVIVDWLLPLDAVMGDVAATLDCVPDTLPAVTLTVAVCVIATALIVAETVFDSATVELKVPVIAPLASVVPVADGVKALPVPVALSTTVAPLIGLSFASRAVTVIVELPLPATISVGAADTVDRAAETAPATPVAVNVTGLSLIPDPEAVAVRVFGPAVVPSLQLPTVAMPLALVVRLAPVTLPPPDAGANTTAMPDTALPD
jgi:hypothetical protein